MNVSATVSATVGEMSATVGEMSATVGERSATVGGNVHNIGGNVRDSEGNVRNSGEIENDLGNSRVAIRSPLGFKKINSRSESISWDLTSLI